MDRRVFVQAALAFAAAPALARAPDTSERPVIRKGRAVVAPATAAASGADTAQVVARAGLTGTTVFAVADAQTGRMLDRGSAQVPLPPASVAKTVTALYALDRLGKDYRFTTRLVATAPIVNGRLDGDLILVGGGDPTLGTDDLARLAQAVRQAGLQQVAGRFLIWDRALPRIDQIDSDQPEHVAYNPAISGLNLNFNRVHFEWKQSGGGYAVAMDARSDRIRPAVSMARMQVANRALPVYTYQRTDNRDDWTVARTALGTGGSRWLPVRMPAIYAGDVMRTLLQSEGIVVPPAMELRQAPSGTAIAAVQSAPLRDICRDMLKYSTNLTAECLGLAVSGADSLKASGQAMSRWAQEQFGARDLALVDHSGLSENSRVTAADMVAILVKGTTSAQLRPLLKEFRLRDAGGGTSVPDMDVIAKTGTLNFVSGLAGYATARSGKVLVFAVFSADLPTRGRIPKDDREAPRGARSWAARARILQSDLIAHWGGLHG